MVEKSTDGEVKSDPSLVVSYWYDLDRGWQALCLGLLITIALLALQYINLI